MATSNPASTTSPTNYRSALIVGAGPGLSASLARLFTKEAGMKVVLAARSPQKLQDIVNDTGAHALACDATDAGSVAALFDQATQLLGGAPQVVIYNASARVRGPITEVDPAAVEHAVQVTAMGAFYVAQQAARRMVPAGSGAILLTGASAGVKGYPQSAAFAMGKFALRGLAQSLARELSPQGIHVGHVVIDGAIRPAGSGGSAAVVGTSVSAGASVPDQQLDPDAIARTYLHLLQQPRSVWTWEIEVRPWVEKF